MAEVIVMAGTVDARQIINELSNKGFTVAATVATGYGAQLLEGCPRVNVHEGRLDAGGIFDLINSEGVKLLIDASHPYAREVSLNAKAASEKANVPYLRFEREETQMEYQHIIPVTSFEEAAERLKEYEGNILLAVGSKNLRTLTNKVVGFGDRLIARVLPQSGVLSACEEAGLTAGNIIAVKGPFSLEMNIAMLKHCDACVMVTKDSGSAGGTREKIEACRALDIPVILVKRPLIDYGNSVGTVEEIINLAGNYLRGES